MSKTHRQATERLLADSMNAGWMQGQPRRQSRPVPRAPCKGCGESTDGAKVRPRCRRYYAGKTVIAEGMHTSACFLVYRNSPQCVHRHKRSSLAVAALVALSCLVRGCAAAPMHTSRFLAPLAVGPSSSSSAPPPPPPPPPDDPVVPIPESSSPIPTTTPPPNPVVLCESPPCPPEGQLSLNPVSGPNNNQQLGTQTVTISGLFFPNDCSKGCVFSTPCDTCEMEVTYYVYFGSATAGCNFYDPDADACQCQAISGEDMLTDCGWTGTPYLHSKYRCKKIICKVQPLYGQQPLKLFFRDKKCKPGKEGGDGTCNIYPAISTGKSTTRIDPDVQLWPLNFTFNDPEIHSVLPLMLPAEGGLITVIGTNFGGDSNFIKVTIDGQKQGVPSSPKLYGTGFLQIQVHIDAHPDKTSDLQVFVGVEGYGGGGGYSKPFQVQFQRSRAATVMAVVITLMGALGVVLLVMLSVHDSSMQGPYARHGLGRGVLDNSSLAGESAALISDSLDEKHFSILRHQVSLQHKIARGAFGNVYKAYWLGAECAVKQIDVWSLQVRKG